MDCHIPSLIILSHLEKIIMGKALVQKAEMFVSADILRPRKQKSVMS